MGDNSKSTQRLPKHHSYASQTQDSIRPRSDEYSGNQNVARPGGYVTGRGKISGGGGSAGEAPASGPKKQTY